MAVTYSVKSQDGKIVANLSGSEVKRLFDEGKINDLDMISRDGSGQWYPARKYKTSGQKSEAGKSESKAPQLSESTITIENRAYEQQDTVSQIDIAQQEPDNKECQTIKQKDHSVNTRMNSKDRMALIEAIETVLQSSATPMHYEDIVETIINEGLCQNLGATPSSSVYHILNKSIKNEKDQSPYLRVGRGMFSLKAKMSELQIDQEKVDGDENEPEEAEEQYAIITSFGMFWRKEAIEWISMPKLLGMQQIGATPVDFCKQLGIYLLYDGREVIYVGRSTDRPLGKRLYEHTIDRLSARWDRFSWFGLLPISDDGQIGLLPENYKAENLIPALEAILIEALEPRQNRKRGDDLAAVEYLQQVDPAIEKKRIKATLDAALNKL